MSPLRPLPIRTRLRLGLLGIALGLVWLIPAPVAGRSSAGGAGLLGPFVELAADLQWIRFQRAHLRGDSAGALVHAERALALAPHEARGWRVLSAHLGLYLASPERQPDAVERARLLDWAVRLTIEGEERCSSPELLAFHRGLLLLTHADQDADIAWPGGVRGLLELAIEAFGQAAREGRAGAAELAESCRERLRT